MKIFNYLIPTSTLVGIVAFLLLTSGSFIFYKFKVNTRSQTDVSAELKEYRKIDKLITAFAYVPVFETVKGYTKTQKIKSFFSDSAEETIQGYCYKEYDISVGYDNVTELFSKYQEAACNKNLEAMPSPSILSTQAVSSEVKGKFSQADCDSWDFGEIEGRKSIDIIKEKINEEQWTSIDTSSKKILMSFMQVYCTDNVSGRAK